MTTDLAPIRAALSAGMNDLARFLCGESPRHISLHGIRYFDVDDLDIWLAARTVESAK